MQDEARKGYFSLREYSLALPNQSYLYIGFSIHPLYHACQMATLRKYWLLILLAFPSIAYILVWLEPTWKETLYHLTIFVLTGIVAWWVFGSLSRIEGKLDAILKKLSER